MSFVPPNTREAAEFRRQIEAANARYGGGVCHRCRRRLESGERTLIGSVGRRGSLMVVGNCCRHRLRSVVGIGIWCLPGDLPAAWLDLIEPVGPA
jgi:hypothetical protein